MKSIFITLTISLAIIGCAPKSNQAELSNANHSATVMTENTDHSKVGHLYVYGEKHSEPWVLKKEADIWNSLYHDKGLRHLFVELPYYTAEYLNQWMHSDNDLILEELYNDWKGTQVHSAHVLDFYRRIKSECPETVFHGIDVGHAYNTTGERYLKYLENRDDKNSELYQRAKECIKQGQFYYNNHGKDLNYRDNTMTENFIREYSLLNGADIMGIFGGGHVRIDSATRNQTNMATQLKNQYGDSLSTNFVSSFLGSEDLSKKFPEFKFREFHRLEDAYNDFKDYPKTGNVLPYNNYPVEVETGNVFVIEYVRKDGTIKKEYHRADGNTYKGMPATNEIKIPE